MSSNGRLLRKLRKVMGAAVTLPSLVACSSQISCGYSMSLFYRENGVSYRYIGRLRTLIIYGRGQVVSHFWDRMGIDCRTVREIGEIVIHEGITEIGKNTFAGCTRLEKIIMPLSVSKIGDDAFWGCKNLKNINIPKGVTEIGACAFQGCKKLEKITIPSSVSKIGPSAFEECENLKDINILRGVTEIGARAFQGCKNLEKVTIPPSVSKIGPSAFEDCENLSNVEFCPRTKEDYSDFLHACFVVKNKMNSYVGVANTLSKFLLPRLVIYPFVFSNCKKLEEISLPSNFKVYIERGGISSFVNIDKNVPFSQSDIDSFLGSHTKLKVDGKYLTVN